MVSFKQIFKYLISTFHWKLSGSPKATLLQRIIRLETCFSCTLYDDELEACWKCGCPVYKKVIRATESCPIKKWLPVKKTQNIDYTKLTDDKADINQSSLPL